MRAHKASGDRRVSAKPRPIATDVALGKPTEEGLSLDPEEMGQSFLRYATEQGNFESTGAGTAAELSPTEGPTSDRSLDGPHFSADASVWENTVGMVLEGGGVDEVSGQLVPALPDDEEAYGDEPRIERGVAEIDLTASAIEEASLLDDESSVLGEVIPKDPQTEAKPRPPPTADVSQVVRKPARRDR